MSQMRSRATEPGAGVRRRQSAAGQAPGEVRTDGVDRLAITRRSLDTLANERCDAASALTRLVPELSCDSFGEFDRDTPHAHTSRVTQI